MVEPLNGELEQLNSQDMNIEHPGTQKIKLNDILL